MSGASSKNSRPDVAILVQKFQRIDDFITSSERERELLQNRLRLAWDEPEPDPRTLAALLLDGSKRLMEQLFIPSLVRSDLDLATHREYSVEDRRVARFGALEQLILKLVRSPADQHTAEDIRRVAADVFAFCKEALVPAQRVRDELQKSIEAVGRPERSPTARQTRRDERDRLIRELRSQHPASSYQELAALAAGDPAIIRLGERITKNTVRKALNPDKNNAKKKHVKRQS